MIGDDYASITIKINDKMIQDHQLFRNLLHADIIPRMHYILNEIVNQQREIAHKQG